MTTSLIVDQHIMESISVRQRLRPTRYAFLIAENDLAAALQAVSLNTALWGGIYNPIVPLTPTAARDALLEAFDPDVLVNLTGGTLPADLQARFEHRTASPADFVAAHHRTQRRYLNLGFNILPALRDVHDREVRFSSDPTRAAVIVPDPAAGWPDFAAFAYGSFAWLPQSDTDYLENFRRALRAKDVPLPENTAPSTYADLLLPIQFTGYGLRVFGGTAGFSSHIVFVGDHRSLADLVQFWNLRATGRTVEFIPIACYRAFEPLIRSVAAAGHYPLNPNVENDADLQKSPSLADAPFTEACDWITTLGLPPLSRRYWQPRFNLDMEWYVGDIHVAELEASGSEEISLLAGSQMTPVKLVSPPYLDEDRTEKGQFTWSVEVTFTGGWDNDLMFSFPRTPAVDSVVRRAVVGLPGEARLGKRGLTVQQDWVRSTLHLMPVRTTDVFAAVFREVGIDAEFSQPGRYAQQIIKKMGSLQGDCRLFKIRGVREIIDRLSDGSILTKGNMYQTTTSTAPDAFGVNWRPELYERLILRYGQRLPLDFGTIFDELLAKRVLRPGFVFRCPNCGKEDWYHVSEFAEDYTCRFCFERQRVNFTSIGTQWQYKADGLFQIKDSALGSVAVILSLWRIEHLAHSSHGRFSTSLNLRDTVTNQAYEIDYAYVVTKMFDTSYELVLGQATRFGDFTDDDMRRMRELADRFGGKSYLAFSTLRDVFSDADKQRLRQLSDGGYRVIAFTREELDPYDLFDRFNAAPHKYAINLKELSENTIHMNLQ